MKYLVNGAIATRFFSSMLPNLSGLKRREVDIVMFCFCVIVFVFEERKLVMMEKAK
jgi:hypothetical protein